ncbi:MAG: hypothetical protein ED557_08970 [Balneola sp.]|nr:MAG: hypothetical protein ED557_08970 [Balneola sp.]
MKNNIPTLAARVKDNPNDSFSKFALALELMKIGLNEKALVLFESIIENDPNYVGVYYHLGALYISLDENKKGINTYKKGIEIANTIKDQHVRSELQSALMSFELNQDS